MLIDKEFYAVIGSILTIYCYVPYFWGLYKKQLKPHVFSWFVWGILTAIAFAAQISSGEESGSWIMGLSALFCFVISLIALRHGEKNITTSDWVTFIFALGSIPLWLATKNPLWSVILISLIDTVASWPTFRKAWHKPREESAQTFAISSFKLALSLFALESVTLVTALYPATLVLINGIIFVMLVVRRRI